MSRILFAFFGVTLLNISCTRDSSHQILNETRDSTFRKYLSMVEKLPSYDTTSIDFKIIKAYYLADTTALTKFVAQFERMNTRLTSEIISDSCTKEPAFADIHSEEKYRFIYSSSFCPFKTSATIVKYKDSVIVNTIVYQYALDTVPCKIIDQSNFAVDSLAWDKFERSLVIADFWGLKSDNGKHGNDGDLLEVYGFKEATRNNPDRSSFISRWSPAYESVTNCFILLLRFSKTKKGCIGAY